MNYKTVKFRKNLAELILKGEKTSTWRLFDDKDLQVGGKVQLLTWEDKESFALAEIKSASEKPLKDITEEGYDGHEKFESKEEMLEIFKKYYGDKVDWDTKVKMIGFDILSKTSLFNKRDANKYDFYCEEVLSGKTKVDVVRESEKIIAYHHTKPFYELHIVVVPKEYLLDLTSINDRHKDLIWELLQIAKDIIKKFLPEWKGIRLITNFGDYQDSPHLHFHIVAGNKLK